MTSLFDILLSGFARTPENVAITHDGLSISYRELLNKALAVGEVLSRLPSGSRVGLLCENSINYAVGYFAVASSGHVVVPLDTSLKPQQQLGILEDCGAVGLIMSGRFAAAGSVLAGDRSPVELLIGEAEVDGLSASAEVYLLDELTQDAGNLTLPDSIREKVGQLKLYKIPESGLPHNCSDDLAAVFYTSGSTGAAKGVMLSHRNLLSNTVATIEYLRLTSDDSVMVILPLYYIYGNSLMLTHFACGGRLVIENRFAYPKIVLQSMMDQNVTGFSGVPSNFMILLNNGGFSSSSFPHLRYLTQAGGALPPNIIRKLADAFPDREIFIMYGQTEASPRISYLPPELLKNNIGSVGVPLTDIELMICDDGGHRVPDGEVGQVVVSGPNVMMGYWNQPDEQARVLRDGRLFTGDLGKIDENGLLWLVSRQKEIIKVGGNRVSTREVEECLLAHPQIVEAAVVGVADDILGEALKAVVVVTPGQALDEKTIRQHCQAALGPNKVPKHVVFMESLPRYRSGKINKPALTA